MPKIGNSATYNAEEVMKEYDVDMRKHKSTNTQDSKIESMDLILCATNSHKKLLTQMYPNLKERIFTMKEYVQIDKNDLDIKDPWGYDISVYRYCAGQIDKCIELLIEKIKKDTFIK